MSKPMRSKNLGQNESTNKDQKALRGEILTDSHNDRAEFEFLRLLELKQKMGAFDGIEGFSTKDLIVKNSPEEMLTYQILRRLNKLSTYDSRWIAITQTMGSNSRQEIAKRLAHRYVQSAALKRVVKDIVGPDKDQGPEHAGRGGADGVVVPEFDRGENSTTL